MGTDPESIRAKIQEALVRGDSVEMELMSPTSGHTFKITVGKYGDQLIAKIGKCAEATEEETLEAERVFTELLGIESVPVQRSECGTNNDAEKEIRRQLGGGMG